MFIKNYIDINKYYEINMLLWFVEDKKISDNKNEKDKITDFDDDSSDMK